MADPDEPFAHRKSEQRRRLDRASEILAGLEEQGDEFVAGELASLAQESALPTKRGFALDSARKVAPSLAKRIVVAWRLALEDDARAREEEVADLVRRLTDAEEEIESLRDQLGESQ